MMTALEKRAPLSILASALSESKSTAEVPPVSHCSDADALRWCLGIAIALQYLHGCKPSVIHRDIKASRQPLVVLLSCMSFSQHSIVDPSAPIPFLHTYLQLENVMLSSRLVASSEAKLADFGLARLAPLTPAGNNKQL